MSLPTGLRGGQGHDQGKTEFTEFFHGNNLQSQRGSETSLLAGP